MKDVQKFSSESEFLTFVAAQKAAGKWAERSSLPSDMEPGDYEGVATGATVSKLSKKGKWYATTPCELEGHKIGLLTGDEVFVEEGDALDVTVEETDDKQYPRRAVFNGILQAEPQQRTRTSIGRKR